MAMWAELNLDSKKFEKGLDIASGGLVTFGKGVGSMVRTAKAALDKLNLGEWAKKGVDAMKQGIADVAAFGDNIDKASQKLGISAKAYQEWEAVMQHSGTSMDAMTMGMKTLANAAVEAAKDTTKVKVKADGTQEITEQANEARDAFKALGISYKDAAKMDRETLFKKSITALQKVKDANKRAQLAQELFGRSAMELGPLLNTSAKDTQAMIDRVNELGGVLSDKAVKDSAAFQDSLQDMNTAIDGVKRQFFAGFLPSAKDMADGITNIVAGLKGGAAKLKKGVLKFTDNLIKEVPKLIRKGLNIAEAVGGAILEAIPKVGAAIIGAIPKLWSSVVTFIRGKGIPAIGKLVESLFGAVFGSKSAAGGVTTNLRRIFSSVMEILDKVGAKAKEFWEVVLQPILKDVLIFIKRQVLPGIQNTLNRIKPLIDELSPIITQFFQNIKGYWDGFVFPVIQAAWDTLINKVIPAIIDWLGKVIPIVEDVFTKVSDFWNTTLLPVLQEIWAYVIEELIPNVIDWLGKVWPIVEDGFKTIVDLWNTTLYPALQELWRWIWEELRPLIIMVWDVYIEPTLQKLGDKFQEIKDKYLIPVWEWVKDTFIKVWDDLKEGMNGLVEFLTGVFSGNWEQAWNGLVDLIAAPFKMLKDILKTPINAVIDLVNGMIDAVENAINWVVNGINTHLTFKVPDWVPLVGGKEWNPGLNPVEWGRIKPLYQGGTLGPGELGMVGEFEPEWLRVINGRAVVTPMSGQRRAAAQAAAPAEPGNERPINIVFELEGAQKWIYRLNKAEEQRVGLKLSKGGPN